MPWPRTRQQSSSRRLREVFVTVTPPGGSHARADVQGNALDQSGLSVVGSIIFRTSVIFVAGKPLISACL